MKLMLSQSSGVLAIAAMALTAFADGPADNRPESVRPVPPPGISLTEDVRRELSEGAILLGKDLEALRADLKGKGELERRWADAAVFQKAVDWSVRYGEIFKTNEIAEAREQLKIGAERISALREGKVPWGVVTGPLVRGYISKVDGSIQPYGLVVPADFDPKSARKRRLDFWFHGRGEQLSELSFIADRRRNKGEFAPPDAFVLHLYGRYCNGSRFAGETDFWEALEDVRKSYPIDEDRLVVRGFSLGGAACWHFATHHAWRWAAAAPGAGFSETADFLKVFQQEELAPAWWERKLWRLYDSTAVPLNTSDTALVAYSGEIDRQKQAADAMASAMGLEGLRLTHLIGPKTAHSYEPGAKAELNRRVDALATQGRDRSPRTVRFQTATLRYDRMAWVVVTALKEHWEVARVEAHQLPESNRVEVTTGNVNGLDLVFDSGEARFEPGKPIAVVIDGVKIDGDAPESDRSWRISLIRGASGWRKAGEPKTETRKRHGLQGPIDDAFMGPFLFVMPTGAPRNNQVGAWAASEARRAVEQWRRQFRGDARVKNDTEVTDEDRRLYNLVLWGDAGCNAEWASMASSLPMRWDGDSLVAGPEKYEAGTHAPVFICPNPRNPDHYVVANSGFTYREYDYLNNARQTPKLPDWAVIDVTIAPNARHPGKIAAAGFFDEAWRWKQAGGQ
jgi:pimeloyl-ACP methyl ester carboxylesterase